MKKDEEIVYYDEEMVHYNEARTTFSVYDAYVILKNGKRVFVKDLIKVWEKKVEEQE